MNAPHDPNETRASDAATASGAGPTGPGETTSPAIDLGSLAGDSLEVGLAAAFGKHAGPPRSSLGNLRPVLLKEAEGESSLVVKPTSDAMPLKDDAGDRYRFDGEIARGGMGAVLRGRDVDLGRDLAIKVLLEKFANRPDVARRFIEEAQIGGQLQHPGVVPIYDIGKFGDRPFFTMKLVKGQTLAAILGERTDPSADRPRLLSIALQVAQAMAYAHAKGVIHRDLKPANIMVGAFGEVQVMDWGLAKVLAEGGVHDEERASRAHQGPQETVIRTARSTGSHGGFGTDTEAGSVLGTPAYMPPEQASGDIALLDRRADVFGLGAILCEILTGKPPYVGRSSEEVRRRAANGDLADATSRLDGCGADAELLALTKQCLAPEPIDRPKDAQGVVDALTGHLDGVQERLQAAERERAVALVRASEERKRRKVQLALAASVALLMVGGGAVGWWQNVQAGARRESDLRRQLADEQRAAADNARLARNAEAVASLLGQAEDGLKAGDAARAGVVLEAAKKRFGEGGAENEAGRLERLDRDLALLRDLDAVDQFRWTVVENHFPDAGVVATRTREALNRFGADPDAASADDVAARVSASVMRDRIVSALDRLLMPIRLMDWDKLPADVVALYSPQFRAEVAALLPKTAGVRAVLRRVDADPYRDAVRDAVISGNRAKFLELAGEHAALEQPPGFAAFLGESRVIPVEPRRQLLQLAVSRRPGDLCLLMTLGDIYPIAHGADERLRWYQAAIAIAPANAAARCNHGTALFYKGEVNEAIACFKRAIELDPKLAAAHDDLGAALFRKRQWDEAIPCFKRAIELDPKLAAAHLNLGAALYQKGQWDEAIPCSKRAIELDPTLAEAHMNLVMAYQATGKLDLAVLQFKELLAHTAARDRAQFATPLATFGLTLLNARSYSDAEPVLRECLAIREKTQPDAWSTFNAMSMLGGALLGQKKYADAEPLLLAGYQGMKQREQSIDEANKVHLPQAMERLAELYEALGKKDEAAQWRARMTPRSPMEKLVSGMMSYNKKRYAAAARLVAEALHADPKLADDMKAQHRYNAACVAALAATTRGQDEPPLDDQAKAALRRQALDWLKADLAARTKQLESGTPADRAEVQYTVRHWQRDPDLAGIRDAAALAKLPADEQKAFTHLWADVAALLKKADERLEPPAKPEKKP